MNNKKIITLIIASLALSSEAKAVSVYDGIYSTNPNVGYIYIREQNGTMIAVLNQTTGGYYEWGAAQGQLNGSQVQLRTIIGTVDEVTNVIFTSPTSYTATIQSCVPNRSGYYCSFPNGSKFTGNKIW